MKQVTFDESDLKKIVRVDSRAKKVWRVFWRTLRQVIYLVVLFFFFFFLLNYSAYAKRFQFSLEPKKHVAKVEPVTPKPEEPKPDYTPAVWIPSLNISAPLAIEVDPNDILEQLKHGVIQYKSTALPGQIGNMVIVGHSSDYPWSDGKYKTVFALIDKLKIGDQIVVPYHDQQYIYEVTGTKIVKPTELSVLNKTDTPTLTLLTCYPVGTTRTRYIVLAKLVSGEISGTQETQPLTSNLPTIR